MAAVDCRVAFYCGGFRRCLAIRLMALWLLGLLAAGARAQSAATGTQPDLRSTTTVVTVPALVRDADGDPVSGLIADQFQVFDRGVRQTVTLDEAKHAPIALVIVMQTGAGGAAEAASFYRLSEAIDAILGGSKHEMMLVTFDSKIEEEWTYPVRSDGMTYALKHQHAGDGGAAILDAVKFGVDELQHEPGDYRRMVLLLSGGVDKGSRTTPEEMLRTLGMGSTAVYAVTYRGAGRRARRRKGAERESAMALAEDALRTNTAEELAALSGGGEWGFKGPLDFEAAMTNLDQDVRSRYALTFQASQDGEGFHALRVLVKGYKNVSARGAYWFEGAEAGR